VAISNFEGSLKAKDDVLKSSQSCEDLTASKQDHPGDVSSINKSIDDLKPTDPDIIIDDVDDCEEEASPINLRAKVRK